MCVPCEETHSLQHAFPRYAQKYVWQDAQCYFLPAAGVYAIRLPACCRFFAMVSQWSLCKRPWLRQQPLSIMHSFNAPLSKNG